MREGSPSPMEDGAIERPHWPRIPVERLTGAYVIAATLWILLSDWVLLVLAPSLSGLTVLSSTKGLAFILVTAALLYTILARVRRVQDSIEASLVRNEARYKRLAEQAPDIIYRYRFLPEPGFEYVSPAVTRVTGYTPAEHYADPQLGMKLVHPDDRQLLADASNEPGQPLLLRWLRRDGQLIWTEQHNVTIRDEAGRVVAIEGVARDVSEREQSAVRLRLLEEALGATANAVVIVDSSGQIQWANGAFSRLTGYTREEIVGQNPRLLRSGQHPSAFYERLWATVLRGDVWRGELVNRRKDGSLYYEEQTITPVYSHGEQITHFIAIKQDVTERVLREREQHTLATLAAALRKTSSRDELTPALLEQLPSLVQARGAALAVREATTGETVFEAGFGIWAEAAGSRLPPGMGVAGRVIATGTAHICATAAELDVAAPLEGDAGSAVCVPLRAHDEVVGALWIHSVQAPDPPEMQLLEAIAGMAGSAIHRAALHEQTAQRLRRLTSLHTIDQSIAASLEIGLTLEMVLEQVAAQLRVDAAAVLLLDQRTQTLSYGAGLGFRTEVAASTRAALGRGLLGEAMLARRPIHLPTIPAADDTFTRGPLLAAEGFRAYYAIPLLARGQLKGALEIFHRTPLVPNTEWLHFLESVAAQTAIAIDNAELFERLQRANDELARAYDSTLEGWARALELRDRETEGHSRRVTALTERLARALKVPDEQLVHIRRGALLHDIGKMGVPDAILRKPGKLDAEEWAQMQEHPSYAQQLLSPIDYLQPALPIPYCHHERWDGSGYPQGLAGESIPLPARIFAVVDVWDALTTERPYKGAWPAEQARSYLREQAGKLFDPAVVEAFLHILAQPDKDMLAQARMG